VQSLVIFLSKFMLRYFTVFTKGMFHPSAQRCQSQSYIRTDSKSASLCWCWWNLQPICILLSLIFLRQLWICWYGVPSLNRSRVCSFQFLLTSSLYKLGMDSVESTISSSSLVWHHTIVAAETWFWPFPRYSLSLLARPLSCRVTINIKVKCYNCEILGYS
jgi:hypothetical protein